jgi:hydrogenase nickel incorporation protein HypA/HybF
MHELSMAAGILDIVQQNVCVADASRVRAVRVRVGDLAGVVPDSLEFCFDAVIADTPYAAAFLAIDRVPALATCGGCGGVTRLAQPSLVPCVRRHRHDPQSGDELQVDVELDDTVEA